MSRRKRKRKHAPQGASTGLIGYAAAILIVLGIGTGALLAQRGSNDGRLGIRTAPPSIAPSTPGGSAPDASPATPSPGAFATPTPTLVPRDATTAPDGAAPIAPARQDPSALGFARVALVFDDAGGSLDDLEHIIAIGRTVTVAVLPGLRHSTAVADAARAAGLEVILHLPIASADKERRLGPGAVTTEMDDDAIVATVDADFRSVPGAVGANNHMGSAGTADRRVMRAVMRAVKARGGFFLDSRTTTGTVVEEVAAEAGVKTARRAIFLDNDPDETAIRQQVTRMIEMAKARGAIVAIGHAQRMTPSIIARMLPEIERRGVQLVPLSTLVAATGAKSASAR